MLVFLQLDATAPAVLERLLAEGRMPVLDELRKSGTWLSLDNSNEYTGLDTADHGLH